MAVEDTGWIDRMSLLPGPGYLVGSGGAVTQITSKTTGVILNKPSGQITLAANALGAGAKVSFSVTTSAVVATDVPVVAIVSSPTANAYRAFVTGVANGSFTITVENITNGSLSQAPVLSFVIIKGVNA